MNKLIPTQTTFGGLSVYGKTLRLRDRLRKREVEKDVRQIQEVPFSSTLTHMSILNFFKGQQPLPFIFRKIEQILKGLDP